MDKYEYKGRQIMVFCEWAWDIWYGIMDLGSTFVWVDTWHNDMACFKCDDMGFALDRLGDEPHEKVWSADVNDMTLGQLKLYSAMVNAINNSIKKARESESMCLTY